MDAKGRREYRALLDRSLRDLCPLIEARLSRSRPLSPAQIEALLRPLTGALASVATLRRPGPIQPA
jgi:hypothetical protein